MKIQKVIFAAIFCSYVQTVYTTHDGEFIDPTDMEHYDQSTKTLKVTLKEKESHIMLKGLLQRLLKSAERCGLDDEENHYDAEVILTRRAEADISNFLKDKPCTPEVLQNHLNTILINFKKHDEDEWKLKFKEFFQMDISKVEKLRIIEDMFTAHFKRILENTKKVGQADEESHYDAEVILSRQAHADLTNFLNDQPCDPEVLQDHLNTILVNFKKHDEDEWKLKFKEFYQMDIAKVEKLWITEHMLTKHFKRILEEAQKTGQKSFIDGKINLEDMESEINKFLNDEDWDQKKLENILENVAFNKDEGVHLWIYFWNLVLLFVTPLLFWTMKKYYWREPDQNEARERVEEPQEEEEEDRGYQEESIPIGIPETAGQQDFSQNVRPLRQRRPNAERDPMDEGDSKKQPTSHRVTHDEKEDKSHKQEKVLTVGAAQTDTPMHRNEKQEHANVLDTEESSSPRTLKTSVQSNAKESVGSDTQSKPGVLRDERDVSSDVGFQKLHQNQERYEQAFLSEPLNQSPSSPRMVELKDENSEETNQSSSHSRFNENTKVRTTQGVSDTPHLQHPSMNVDDESDFIVISESAPESLAFVQHTDCNES